MVCGFIEQEKIGASSRNLAIATRIRQPPEKLRHRPVKIDELETEAHEDFFFPEATWPRIGVYTPCRFPLG